MGIVQCGSQLMEPHPSLSNWNRSRIADNLPQGLPLDKLEDNQELAILKVNVVDRWNIRMRHLGKNPGLPPETFLVWPAKFRR